MKLFVLLHPLPQALHVSSLIVLWRVRMRYATLHHYSHNLQDLEIRFQNKKHNTEEMEYKSLNAAYTRGLKSRLYYRMA